MQDYITMVFDGIDKHNVFEEVKRELASMQGRCTVYCHACHALQDFADCGT